MNRSEIEEILGISLPDDPEKRAVVLTNFKNTWEKRADVYSELATGRLETRKEVLEKALEDIESLESTHEIMEIPMFRNLFDATRGLMESTAFLIHNAKTYQAFAEATMEMAEELNKKIKQGRSVRLTEAQKKYVEYVESEKGVISQKVANRFKISFPSAKKMLNLLLKKGVIRVEDVEGHDTYFGIIREGSGEGE